MMQKPQGRHVEESDSTTRRVSGGDPAARGDASDPGRSDAVDSLVDGWGLDSFPASDPPGCLPPSLTRGDRAKAPNAGASKAKSG